MITNAVESMNVTEEGPALAAFDQGTRRMSNEAIYRHLSSRSEEFAHATTAMANALERGRRVTIVVSQSHERGQASFACWRCVHDMRGLDLIPFALEAFDADDSWKSDGLAAQIALHGGRGDLLVACDAWGDDEVLCRAMRQAARVGITTVSITSDVPSLLAVSAGHAIRVPNAGTVRYESIIMALRYVVQTVGGALTSRTRPRPRGWALEFN